MNHPLANILPNETPRRGGGAHAKPATDRPRLRDRPAKMPRHARGITPPMFEQPNGRHAAPYSYPWEQAMIELGLGTSTGKHAAGAAA